MKSIRPYLAIISILILVIGVLLFIWFTPSLFDLDEDAIFANVIVQSLLTIIIALIGGFTFYILAPIRKHAETVEQSDAQPSLKGNLKQQKTLFKQHAHETFNNLTLAFQIWGNKKQRYLCKLPWYIVLGSANSGKSTLLNNSGLDFSPTETLGPDPLQTGDNHRDYNWRFSKEAVILDIATGQPREGTENYPASYWGINLRDPFWAGVLKLIKRYRRKKPLNGALITLNLPELLLQSDKVNQTQKQALKSILQAIHQELQIQTPIYLILTKCDLIAGFQEFFVDLSKEDREQVWGIAFPPQIIFNQKQSVAYFNEEFDKLIARLQERLLLRLEVERDMNKRLLISYFPQQIQLCKRILADFILQDDHSQIRGIYFVSNIQNGKPYDFLLSALTAKYHLTASANHPYLSQEKPYFIQHLFREIFLPEASWVGNSPYLQRLNTYIYRASWMTALLALSFGTIGLSVSYARNKNNLEIIQRYLPDYQQAVSQLTPANKSLTDTLPLLNIIKNIHAIYAKSSNKWLLYFEIYQPVKISDNINDIWQRTLSNQFMTRVAICLENTLMQNQDNSAILYQTLKGYLVFSPATNTNPNWLKPPIAYDVSNTLKDQPDEQAQIKALLSEALTYPVDPIPLNQTVIEKTRAHLRKVMPIEFAYYEMKQETETSEGQLILVDQVGPTFANIFNFQNNAIQGVPALYTLEGYHDLHGKKSEFLIKHTAEIYWILGLDKTVNGADLVTQMTPALWNHYNNDYINYWDTLLSNIQVAPFNNLSQGIQTLDLLAGPRSPLLGLLNTVKENSYLVRGKNLHIAPHFAPLNAISGLPGKPSAQYTAMMKNLIALRDYLTTINSAPNVAQMEFQEASTYLQNKAPNNPIAILKKQAQQMPAPLNRWLNEIADNSFALLLQGAHQTINAAWQSNVMPTYQTDIQGRFPFNSQSDAFVNMTSFGNFFGANGTFAQFFQTYLAPFIDTATSAWHQRQVGNYSLGIALNTLDLLQKAALIHNLYFQSGNQIPLTQFSIRPRFLDPQSSSVFVQLASQNLTYQHGPQASLSWKWPIPSDTQQVNISFSDFQGQNFSRTFDGPWGWFKLLSTTQLQATGAPGHYIWTINQDKHQASFDLWASNNMPLFNLQVLENFNLPNSI